MTNSSRTLAWVLWGGSLLACPITIFVLGEVYRQPTSPESFQKPFPWASYVIDVLFSCHLGISVVAALAAFWLVPYSQGRLLAWFVVLVMLGITGFVLFVAGMAVSGRYL